MASSLRATSLTPPWLGFNMPSPLPSGATSRPQSRDVFCRASRPPTVSRNRDGDPRSLDFRRPCTAAGLKRRGGPRCTLRVAPHISLGTLPAAFLPAPAQRDGREETARIVFGARALALACGSRTQGQERASALGSSAATSMCFQCIGGGAAGSTSSQPPKRNCETKCVKKLRSLVTNRRRRHPRTPHPWGRTLRDDGM